MADELATYASLRGAQVLWGRCYESEGAPVYWPWVQVIRSYVHDTGRGEAALRDGHGRGGHRAGRLDASTIGSPACPTPPALEPEQARFRLFDSVATFLKNAARNQPLVVVLDDLHSADEPSLLLLQFLARELRGAPLLVVATYRDMQLGRHHPLSDVLVGAGAASTHAGGSCSAGFTEADIARYIEMTARLTPRPGSSRRSTARPRATRSSSARWCDCSRPRAGSTQLDPTASWSVGIPQGVREVVGRRLEHLTDDCNEVLTIASVMGREFDLDTLEIVSDRKGNELLDLLDEAIAARLVVEQPDIPGHYRFSHAIVRETLYGDITPTRRMRLHRADRRGDRAPARPGGAPAGRARPALRRGRRRRVVRQGDRTTPCAPGTARWSSLAYEEGARLYQMALHALELRDPDDGARIDLLIALGDAQIKSGEPDAGRAIARGAAAAAAKALGHGDQVARAPSPSAGGSAARRGRPGQVGLARGRARAAR